MAKDWAVPKGGRQGGGEEGRRGFLFSSSLEQLVATSLGTGALCKCVLCEQQETLK